MNKIISYLGFAQRSNNCVMGQTALKKCLKQLHLVIVCDTASLNLKNLAKNLANKHKCELIISQVELKTLLNKNDIKIVGITDENLSKAIVDNKEKISLGKRN
ncbi:MAG: hypothetical protein IJ415_00540 [Clostridia bacterium]|nr:hypothetical protein [Clostridia bacterium]